MVATRRGVRVYSPSKTNPDQSSDVQATPSSSRRTRSAAKQAESPTHNVLVEACTQFEKSDAHQPGSPSLMKRCSRASRLHSPEQPCTPMGSTHDADISDVDSLCSVTSDTETRVTRTRSRRQQPCPVSQEDEEVSEVESCSSAVSAKKDGRSSRRSTRRKVVPESPEPVDAGTGDKKVDSVPEVDSCSSAVSESQRVTRSQRRTARTRSSTKQQTEDSELSDADSCMSSVSGADVSKSTRRRSTRSRKQTGPIPIYLDEASEGSASPAPTTRSRRPARGKTAGAVDVSEPQSCDSEGFESGPSYSITTRRQRRAGVTDSDSELSQIGSPRTTRSRGTPCSSRTGSGTSSRGAPASSRKIKDLSIVLEKELEVSMEDTSLNDSRLETTVIAEDADCTLLEEDRSMEEKDNDAVNVADTEKQQIIVSDDVSAEPPAVCEEAVREPAVTVTHQQEEPCDETKSRETSEIEMLQETVQPSEPSQSDPAVTVTLCESASETTEAAVDGADADAHSPQEDAAVDTGEDAAVETRPSEEEKMEVNTLSSDAQQVVEVQAQTIQVTSGQQQTIAVQSGPEEPPSDVIVQDRKKISLLESSEDEEEEEEDEVSEEVEEEEHMAEKRGAPSTRCEAAGTSMDGLFMIDTRPGEQADEQYYMEKKTEQQEEEEEFMDEEGDDDDDHEDTNILFSCRNPQLKEMSSRIDPGIRMKELGGLYINFDGSKSKPASTSLQKLKEKKIQDEVMKKSVIGPDFEKKDAVPPYSESKQALKLKHRVEREKTTGESWFNMKAPELTPELKGDLKVLKMRGSLDPKRFYKKNDRDGFPKYFQVGTVVDNPVDFYHSRVPQKARKRTMVEELLADAEFRQTNKKKYQQIMAEKAAQAAGKRKYKKKKFHRK
ncbi:uncharacterized protein V6R79_022944 [Siganus canaliculatus]